MGSAPGATFTVPVETSYRSTPFEPLQQALQPVVFESIPKHPPAVRFLHRIGDVFVLLAYEPHEPKTTEEVSTVFEIPLHREPTQPVTVVGRNPRDMIMRGAMKALADEKRVTSKVAQGALSTWLQIRKGLPDAVLPLTQVTEDGAVQMAWEKAARYVDIEIYGPNQIEWFFQDRTTGEHEGSGDEPETFSERLVGYLRRVFLAK